MVPPLVAATVDEDDVHLAISWLENSTKQGLPITHSAPNPDTLILKLVLAKKCSTSQVAASQGIHYFPMQKRCLYPRRYIFPLLKAGDAFILSPIELLAIVSKVGPGFITVIKPSSFGM